MKLPVYLCLNLIILNKNNMKNMFFKSSILLVVFAFLSSCTREDSPIVAPVEKVFTKRQVIENYANIAFANYKKAYDDAVILETALSIFTTTPTLANLNIAKEKWKLSRESYGTTEAFRFSNGPIDNATGPEALINAWPLDENFIDYTSTTSDGIVSNAVAFPTISKSVLEGLNENGGEKNISVGYHAIEFLLWGQDNTLPSANLPGQRPYTDYVAGVNGTNGNQARRAQYLNACADLLSYNLEYMVNEWKVGGAYRNTFFALPENQALKNMYLGLTTLALAELPTERMDVALLNADQEDEHSCFSDNTHRDIILNLQGIINIYKGNYGAVDGASLEDLVKKANAQAGSDTETSLNLALTKVNAILNPFDLAISGEPNNPERAKVKSAVLQLKNFGSNLLNGATKIGITVN